MFVTETNSVQFLSDRDYTMWPLGRIVQLLTLNYVQPKLNKVGFLSGFEGALLFSKNFKNGFRLKNHS